MSSCFVNWFLTKKLEVTVDEVVENKRSHLILSDHDLSLLQNHTMDQIYHSKVIHLLLSRNSLTVSSFPRDFGFFAQKLVTLSVAGNNLNDIPQSFSLLKSLRGLNISRNPLTCQELPLVLTELKQLQSLFANSANIKSLPEEMFQLKELKVLGLRHNAIEVIPPVLFCLPKLQWVTMAYNRIRIVPDELANAKNLVHFNLNFNRVSVIPSNTWNQMLSLRYLYLRSNLLVVNEDCVRAMQELPKLRRIDLSHNVMQFHQNPPITDKLIVTRETRFRELPTDDAEVQTEEIWRREGGLSADKSVFQLTEKASSTCQHSAKEEMSKNGTSTAPRSQQPRRHSEPSMAYSSPPREVTQNGRWKTGSCPLDTDRLLSNERQAGVGWTRRTVRELNTHESLLASNFEIPLEPRQNSDVGGYFEEEFELSSSRDTLDTETETTSDLTDESLEDEDGDDLGAGAEERENEPAVDMIMDAENSDWEDSVPTSDLDLCDNDSDLSELEDLPFDELEAKFTLVSILL